MKFLARNKNNFVIVILLTLLNTTVYADCHPSIASGTPTSRFEILDNGSEVKDKKTGLIWQRCSIGQTWNINGCSGKPTALKWKDALNKAKEIGNNYRLPNIRELQSIVEIKCHYPAINTTIFVDTPSNSGYWSSSPYVLGSSLWTIAFTNGTIYTTQTYNMQYVRAVRSE